MRIRNRTVIVAAVLSVIVWSVAAEARTWRVEKDGSGDYAVIQDAIDAAASGDTIRIGVGRFDDTRPYTFPGGDYLIIANVWQEMLTVIGAGRSETILGSDVPPADYFQEPYHYAINDDSNSIGGGQILLVSDLRVENQTRGMEFDSYSSVKVERCDFRGGGHGARVYVGAHFVDCGFDDFISSAIWGTGSADTLLVSESRFGNMGNWGVHVDGGWVGVIRDCVMNSDVYDGVAIGLDNCYGEVTGCEIIGYRGGVDVYNPQLPIIRNNTIDVEFSAVSGNAEAFTMEENLLSSQLGPTVRVTTRELPHQFRTNHILPPRHGMLGGYAFEIDIHDGTDGYRLDVTGNWWGTTDAVEIADMINDSEDEPGPNLGEAYVDFEPFLDTPVSVEKTSLSDLKAIFR